MMQSASRKLARNAAAAAPAAGKQGQRFASSITSVKAREVLDSRGQPTVEVDLTTQDGLFRAIVPSGASTGTHEACELRDGGKRYNGKGVSKAVDNVNLHLAKLVKGMDVTQQQRLDEAMIKLDGTANKTNMGANAILGVSMAAAHAGAAAKKVPLYQHFADLAGNKESKFVMPTPCLNVINGGSHAGNKLAFQEFFMIPTGAKTFKEAMQMGCEAYQTLKKVIKTRYGGDATLIGDEGGFAPPVDATQGLELLMEAIKQAGYEGKIVVGLDVAASEFKVKGKEQYDLDFKTPAGPKKDPNSIISSQDLMKYYQDMVAKFPIVTIEDAFDEDDWGNWSKFVASMNGKIQIVGDDLTCTNMSLIKRAVEEKAANALLLKVNQIGSITESIQAVQLSKKNGWGVMTSHRSGETEDTTIADIAVGLCTGQIKAGAPARSERTAKYNRILRIEEELGSRAVYAGANFRKPESLIIKK
jgi:enolase